MPESQKRSQMHTLNISFDKVCWNFSEQLIQSLGIEISS